jgi:hypothetical protein
MKKIILIFICVFTSFAFSQTLMPTGPQAATFSSMTRGYHFTAPVAVNLCALHIPPDASTGTQDIRVVRFTAGAPPAYAGTTTSYVTLLSVSGVAVTSSTNSVSSITGAAIVTGGVGIGSSVSVGGRLQLFNSSNYTAFVSSATGNTVYTLPATSPAIGSSVLQSTSAGVLSWVPLVASAAAGNTSQNIFVNAAGTADVFHQVL